LDQSAMTPDYLARPVTPHTAASAAGYADASSSSVETFKQWATPQVFGGPSKASRRRGKELAEPLKEFRKEELGQVPGYGKAVGARDGLSALSTGLGVASTGAGLSGVGAAAAPALSIASNGARIGAGAAELGAGAALSQRPDSPTGRGRAQQRLHVNDGQRNVYAGTAGLTGLPGASTAAGVAYDRMGGASAKEADQVALVEGVRQAEVIKHGRRAGKVRGEEDKESATIQHGRRAGQKRGQ
jgi:hypothetical protein